MSNACWPAQSACSQARPPIHAFPNLYKSFALIKRDGPGIVLVDFERDPTRRKPARLAEEKTGDALSFRFGRNGELIEIASRRIDGCDAKETVRAIECADYEGTRCLEGSQMIDKPSPPRFKVDAGHGLPPASHPKIGKAWEVGVGYNAQI
jgi:hypothetical protein